MTHGKNTECILTADFTEGKSAGSLISSKAKALSLYIFVNNVSASLPNPDLVKDWG